MSRSPFPGMDPYLEAPSVWPDAHFSLMCNFAELLAPPLAPNYFAALKPRTVIEYVDLSPATRAQMSANATSSASGDADSTRPTRPSTIAMPTHIISIHICERITKRAVTVIELLTPVNKQFGRARRAYLKRRTTYLNTTVHFLEIDLLRQHPRMPLADPLPQCDYLVILRNMYQQALCDVWPLSVRDPLPILPVPLLHPDPDVPLDVGQGLRTVYERARYDLRVDYTKPPNPPLAPDDTAWAQEISRRALTL